MKTIRLILLTLAVLSVCGQAWSADTERKYTQFARLSSDSLCKMGHRFSLTTEGARDAIMCFSIVASRYRKDMSESDRQLCIEASLGEWAAYFNNFYDVGRLFEILNRTEDMARQTQKPQARLWFYYGLVNETLYDQTHYADYGKKASAFYAKAFKQNVQAPQPEGILMDMLVSNMLLLSYKRGSTESMHQMYNEYSTLRLHGQNANVKAFNIGMYKGLRSLVNKHYKEAQKRLELVAKAVPNDANYARYRYIAAYNIASAYAAEGRYAEAIRRMDTADTIAQRESLTDCRLEIYARLSEWYEKAGMKAKSLEFGIRHYHLKDSILNFQQASKVSAIEFASQIDRLEAQQAEADYSRKTQNIVLCCVLVVALMCMTFCAVIIRRNTQLRQRNKKLYLRNAEIMNMESSSRALAEQYKQRIKSLEEGGRDSSKGFKPSSLDEGFIDKVAENIVKVMEEDGMGFESDFSVQTLADAIHVKYKTISEVVHEKWGSNFNTFVNTWRVREVCKRIDSMKYDHLSMDGIMTGVGFKSRATFIASFKKVTGLKPSEYQHIARETASRRKTESGHSNESQQKEL